MKAHGVPTKSLQGRDAWRRFGLRVFFHRYELLENSNFPILTKGNAASLVMALVGLFLRYQYAMTNEVMYRRWGNFLLATAIIFFTSLTFVFTAPTIGRVTFIRRLYLIFVHYILCRFMESIDWCTGTNKHGYINHLTAHKLLDYGYITPEKFDSVCTMAIVRNPYTRMVSLYLYNRFGPLEPFNKFVRRWYRMLWHYRTNGEMEEWTTPCHGIPQFEYTHFERRQLVQSIVKQEELGQLKTSEGRNEAIQHGSSVKDLPEPVLQALLGMPRTNQRSYNRKWYDYYCQESLNLTFELYQHDFEIFQYSPALEQRPDLASPESALSVPAFPRSRRGGGGDNSVEQMMRDSWKERERNARQQLLQASARVSSRRTSMTQIVSASTLGGAVLRTSTFLSLEKDSFKVE